jgi:hypothetical protein
MPRLPLAPLALCCGLFALSASALAQVAATLPPPPPLEDSEEPQITIIPGGDSANTVTEYRLHGKLYMVKVTPPHGEPYYLIDHEGKGQMVRDNSGPVLSVPMWVIKSW